MRRVQAQRRILEEQHAACPPVKASPSIAVGAPGTVSKKAAKTPKPAPPKVPEVVPIAVPIVEEPKVIPKVEPPKEEPVTTPAPVEVKVVAVPEAEVVQEVEIPEVPAPVITEEPVIEAPPVEAAPVDVAFVQEEVEEPIIPEAEPEIEVTLPAEAPVAAAAEIEVVPEETAVIAETEQTHELCEPEPTAFTEEVASDAKEEPITDETEECIVKTAVIEEVTVDTTNSEVEADIKEVGSQSIEDSGLVEAVVDEPESIEPEPKEVVEAIIEATAVEDVEADIGDVASQSEESESVDSGPVEVADEPTVATETVECVESEPVDVEEEGQDSCSSQEEEEEDCEMEVLSEEAPIETNHITEDIPIPNEGLPVEQDALPLPPLTAAPEPVTQVEEIPVDTADIMVDDFVVTDTSDEVIEHKIIELLPEKPTVAVCEIFGPGPIKMTPEPELITAAEDTLNDVAASKCFSVEEPMPEPCQIPLDQESVTNTSINMLIGTEWMAQQQVPGLDC